MLGHVTGCNRPDCSKTDVPPFQAWDEAPRIIDNKTRRGIKGYNGEGCLRDRIPKIRPGLMGETVETAGL